MLDARTGRRLSGLRIVVHKAARRLELFDGERLVRAERIGLGSEPVRPKEREGDGATPEGDYVVCTKNPESRYHLALGLSYPGPHDAARGLAAAAIRRDEHDRIVEAARAGARPPWDTALGGEIMIHGHGAGSDWTAGCIALDDSAMRALYEAVPLGTPVTIRP